MPALEHVSTGDGYLVAHCGVAHIGYDVPFDRGRPSASIRQLLGQCTRTGRKRRELRPRSSEPRERHRSQSINHTTQLRRRGVVRAHDGVPDQYVPAPGATTRAQLR